MGRSKKATHKNGKKSPEKMNTHGKGENSLLSSKSQARPNQRCRRQVQTTMAPIFGTNPNDDTVKALSAKIEDMEKRHAIMALENETLRLMLGGPVEFLRIQDTFPGLRDEDLEFDFQDIQIQDVIDVSQQPQGSSNNGIVSRGMLRQMLEKPIHPCPCAVRKSVQQMVSDFRIDSLVTAKLNEYYNENYAECAKRVNESADVKPEPLELEYQAILMSCGKSITAL